MVSPVRVPPLVSEDPVMPTGRAFPVKPLAAIAVAVIVPVPEAPSDALLPTTIVAWVFVPVVIPLNTPGPVAPVAPVAPVLPVAPVTPVAPVDPVAPVTPVSPVSPVGPVAPVGPEVGRA